MKKKIFIIAAHPDDEILGCGATISRLAEEGNSISILILGEGITSRQNVRDSQIVNNQIEILHSESENAAKLVGAMNSEVLNFPDNRFDSLPILDIIKSIEVRKEKIRPDIIFTHHPRDLNVDHRKTFEAVLTACRPFGEETVREIYSFEIPSSTEWQAQGFNNSFTPNLYIKVEDRQVMAKISAMESYSSEKREYPHPRSPEALKVIASWRGINIGAKYAECFEIIRKIV
jgi:LmbE family N-acetylglucosaminyl deacetylase